ncbi:MAG: dihydroorotate dehydrogenase [Deltaproteobacteria bacterium]|jgi:dihydroorotate dehydrogenase (NAD+) catalytic subunit|nr:dihydroorotate dehydrogenase [Deltaproteobacteria bacterium]
MAEPDLSTDLGFLTLKNPVIAASGTFGYGLELLPFCPPEALGAVIPKGVSLAPWAGNPGPRACEASGGLINAIGLENMGIERFLTEALPPLKARGATVGVNVLGSEPEDYPRLAERIAGSGADFIELNISCPNLKKGGLSFGQDPNVAGSVIRESVAAAKGIPVVAKLPPLVSDMANLASISEKSGASAISLVNSVPALAVDLATKGPKLANVTGGLSGPPIKPLALRQVYVASGAVSIPVIGMGGIFTAEDALEFLLAGASAVQVGTATLADPRAPLRIIQGIGDYLRKTGESLRDILSQRLPKANSGLCSGPPPATKGTK